MGAGTGGGGWTGTSVVSIVRVHVDSVVLFAQRPLRPLIRHLALSRTCVLIEYELAESGSISYKLKLEA